MNITSINEINRLRNTVSKVDQEISRRRTAIKRNMVRNAGIATHELKQMELQNNQRKAYLHVNRGQIEAIYKTSRQYNTMKTSFITPDGPKERGNRRSDRERRQELDTRRRANTGQETLQEQKHRNERIRQAKLHAARPRPKFTITKKQRKKFTPPSKHTITIPKPVFAPPATPTLPITKVTDAIRQQTHIAAKQKSLAIKKQMDARRDAELVKQGKLALVAKRRRSEMEKQKREMAHKLSVARRAKINDIKTRAISSTKSARTYAQKRASSRFRSMRPSVPTFRSRNSRGIIPLALTMTLSDKRRAASINEQVRTKETPVTQTAKEHLIEDVRQAPVVAKTTHSKEYYTMVKNLAAEKAMVIKMIEEASRDPSSAEFFGNERVQYWRNRAFSLVGQVEQMVKNELVRWDQGALNAGVAISTDNRSQSMRKMSAQEFNNYIQPKKMQMIEPFMKEAQEEVRRAEIKQAEIKKQKEAIITARNQPQTHSQETQELMQYNSWYEGETAAWFNTIQQDRNLMPKLRSSPVMNRITEYLDYPVTRRAKIMKDFGDKKLIMGKPMSLTAAKAEIEHAWKSVIPLAVSEVQKVEPTYTAQARPIPTNLKQNLLPQGSSLGAAGVSRNITIHPTRQLRLSGIDNHRRSGRPILSEQQGTRGLAGLFPALRSSMQGALKR